jgi:amino acid transporter
MSYCIPSAVLGAAIYFDFVLTPVLGPSTSLLRVALLTIFLMGVAAFAAFRGVRLSTRLMLGIEGASLALMSFLVIAGMTRAHAWVDHAQLRLSGVHFAGMQGGIVVAFMLMAGFEGATSLGEESDDPKKSIPRAILGCMLPLSLVYLIATYCLVALGNRGLVSGQSSGLTVPFDDLARAIQLPWLGPLSSLGVALSYFACALGCLTVASRVLFSMAREGRLWRAFAAVHKRVATPHRAIGLISLVSLVIPLSMLLSGEDIGTAFNFLVQLGSIGIIGGYLIVALALPLYLKRRRLLRRLDLAVATAASAMLAFVVFLSVYPPTATAVLVRGVCVHRVGADGRHRVDEPASWPIGRCRLRDRRRRLGPDGLEREFLALERCTPHQSALVNGEHGHALVIAARDACVLVSAADAGACALRARVRSGGGRDRNHARASAELKLSRFEFIECALVLEEDDFTVRLAARLPTDGELRHRGLADALPMGIDASASVCRADDEPTLADRRENRVTVAVVEVWGTLTGRLEQLHGVLISAGMRGAGTEYQGGEDGGRAYHRKFHRRILGKWQVGISAPCGEHSRERRHTRTRVYGMPSSASVRQRTMAEITMTKILSSSIVASAWSSVQTAGSEFGATAGHDRGRVGPSGLWRGTPSRSAG